MAKKLNPKQLAFCEAFAKNGFLNGTQSAVQAGYSKASARSQAAVMLKLPHVASYLAVMKERRNQLVTADATMVVNGYATIAAANPLDCLMKGADGLWKGRDPADLPPEVLPAIARIHVRNLKAKDGTVTQEFKYELHDKMGALLQLGRHFNVFGEDDGPKGGPTNIAVFSDVPSDQLEAMNVMLKQLLSRGQKAGSVPVTIENGGNVVEEV